MLKVSDFSRGALLSLASQIKVLCNVYFGKLYVFFYNKAFDLFGFPGCNRVRLAAPGVRNLMVIVFEYNSTLFFATGAK